MLEAGRRFGPRGLPAHELETCARFLWLPRLGCCGIQRLTLLRDVLVLSGAGVGGGSLVYANTLYEPLGAFWDDPQWAGIADWRDELAPHYATARRMLGAAPVPFETPADRVLQQVAERLGVAETYRPTDVAVYFGEPGVKVPDPYFGGAGPPRSGCIRCGGCMVGCRHGAKNTLDRNYLWLAERRRRGDLPRARGRGRSCRWRTAAGRSSTRRPGRGTQPEERFRAEQVVLAAGVLGTLRLLFGARERARLPGISPRLGEAVRTNSEAIVGATCAARRRGLLDRHRDRLVDLPERAHAHRAGPLPEGLERDGAARHAARRRRRPPAASAALPRGRPRATRSSCCAASRFGAGRSGR